MQWYDRGGMIRALSFDKIPVWVQVHDIPMRFLNRRVAEDLCDVVDSVCRMDDVTQMDGGSFIRVRILIDINKPLCRARHFSSSRGEQGWVSFKYERLPNICYWCGCLSHVDKDYELWLDSEEVSGGGAAKSRGREDFEERIEEIDRELNKFGKDEISKSGFDKDLIFEEDVSADHVTQLDSDQIMHAEALFPYEDHS
ncbi:hypothetical protein SO802_026856 [Lithocarpus litseifolius]|uniref:Zinc knuckle CX2CX4HX4C domain-containing protein n=1 Tax=Lithocarpus litseifolius TaxID=425828 RepID=A0AAW2C2K8_9ROSI